MNSVFNRSILVRVKTNLRSLVLQLTASLTIYYINGQHATQENEGKRKVKHLEILKIIPYALSDLWG